MTFLSKIATNKNKAKLQIPDDVKSRINSIQAQIRRNVGISLVTKLVSTPLEVTNYENTEEFKAFEQTYKQYPESVHYVLKNGDNLITFAFKQRKLGMLFNTIKRVSLGEIAEAKYGEKEPLCFSLFDAKNLKALEEMNEYLKINKLNPKDVNGNKWSDVYKNAYPIIKAREDQIFKRFKEEAVRNNHEMKYYNKELKR